MDICKIQFLRNMILILQLSGRRLTHCLKSICREQNVKVNPDTIYLNHFLKYVREGIFKGLNNEK